MYKPSPMTATCLLLAASASALAQTGPSIMLLPWEEDTVAQFQSEYLFTPTEADVTGADVDLSIYDARGRVRLNPDSSYNPTLGFSYTQFDISTTDAALPDRLIDLQFVFGGSFGDLELGQTLGGGWQAGYTVGLGYAGTAPFNDGDAWYGTANLFAVKPIDRDTRWLIGISYEGNRTFLPDVPLPAVTYFGRLNDTVTYGIGLPFNDVTWTPTDRWTVEFRSLLFFDFTVKATYQMTDQLALFGEFARRNEAFVVSGSPDNRRLLFQQERLEAGLTYEFNRNLTFTVAGGIAFSQEFDFGYDTRDPRGVRDLDDSGFIRVGLDLQF
ncbi:MAG: DUF6268 family outer membrane beta-barrel protein [Planctomycetota bacterium]